MPGARSVTPLFLLVLVGACRTGGSGEPTPTGSASAAIAAPPPARSAEATPLKLVMAWKKRGFKSPESVVHDTKSDLYLVSNIDGKPLERDNKGFISKVAPAADGVETKWIESGKNGVTLHAPKGMALAGETLYVADIDTVRLFDRASGRPTGEVKVPGATFLNDVVVAPDGRVFVSDTGRKDDGSGGTVPGGNDAIYVLDKARTVSTFAKSPELAGPNGLVWAGDRPFVASFGSDELYSLAPNGARSRVEKAPGKSLDGLAYTITEFWVSSWETRTIYRAPIQSMAFVPAVVDVTSPADMTIDTTRQRLIVPLLEADELRAYAIESR